MKAKTRKRALSLALVCLLVLSSGIPLTAFASEDARTSFGTGGEIIAFEVLSEEITNREVPLGTSLVDLHLPENLTATVRIATGTDTEKPVIASGEPVAATTSSAIEAQASSLSEESTLSEAEQDKEENTPAEGIVSENKQNSGEAEHGFTKMNIPVPVVWNARPDYDGDTAGVYTFTAGVESFAVSAPLPKVTVIVGKAAEDLIKVLPDLSNLEAPPPSPARSGNVQPLEIAPTGMASHAAPRQAVSSFLSGLPTQDNPSTIYIQGTTLQQIRITDVKGDVSEQIPITLRMGTPNIATAAVGSVFTSPRRFDLTDSNVQTLLDSAMNNLADSRREDAIGSVVMPSSWYNNQVKVIFADLNQPGTGAILLGYFDPNDFPGGAASDSNSDLYLYIDVSTVPGGGWSRFENQRDLFIGTILHEYAHMVNYSVGYVHGGVDSAMEVWLDEGIANSVAFNSSGKLDEEYLSDFLAQNFADGVGYVPMESQWGVAPMQINANYGASTLMVQDLLQYDTSYLDKPVMQYLINYEPGNRNYASSLASVGEAYGAGQSFNTFFTQFNLDMAVDNDADDHDAALAALGNEFYGLDAISYVWRERYGSGRYDGVTGLAPNTPVDVSSEFGNRSYYSHIYLADTVGSDCSEVEIEVPNDPQTRYFVITPHDLADVDTATEWQDCPKQAAALAAGANTVTVGSNNQFAVLAVQYSTSMSSGQALRFSPISSAKDIASFRLNGVDGAISGSNITVVLPTGTDVTNLTPAITHTGVSISPTGPQDFMTPVTYTVSAQDGSTRDYTVTVEFVDGPYVDTSAIALNAGETKTLYISLGQSGNASDSVAISSSDAGVVSVSPTSLEASGSIVITGIGEGNTVISVSFSGGNLLCHTSHRHRKRPASSQCIYDYI